MTYFNHPVSTIILADEAVQPSGATGDARVVSVVFSDGSLPVYSTIALIKAIPAMYSSQAAAFNTQAGNLTARAAVATDNATASETLVAIVSSL